MQVVAHFYGGEVVAHVEFLVDEAHGIHAVLAFPHGIEGRFVFDMAGLQVQQARKHLQVVLHPVVDFFDQKLLFLIALPQLAGQSEQQSPNANSQHEHARNKPQPDAPLPDGFLLFGNENLFFFGFVASADVFHGLEFGGIAHAVMVH